MTLIIALFTVVFVFLFLYFPLLSFYSLVMYAGYYHLQLHFFPQWPEIEWFTFFWVIIMIYMTGRFIAAMFGKENVTITRFLR